MNAPSTGASLSKVTADMTKKTETTTPPSLEDLRREIDAIDEQLHDLLIRRGEIGLAVAQAKKGTGSIFRPAREAQILRKRASQHRGPLALSAIIRIWRELLASMTLIQGKFSVAVHLPDGDGAYWDLARDHFGVQAQTVAHLSPGAVLRVVADDASTVGVLPWPMDGERDPWWRHLCTGDDKLPKIIGRLPAMTQPNSRSALVVGQITLEESGDDRTFLAVETLEEMSRTRLLSRLGKAGFDVEFITDHNDSQVPLPVWSLIEVDGFVALDDPRIKTLINESAGEIGHVSIVGVYPVPLALKKK